MYSISSLSNFTTETCSPPSLGEYDHGWYVPVSEDLTNHPSDMTKKDWDPPSPNHGPSPGPSPAQGPDIPAITNDPRHPAALTL